MTFHDGLEPGVHQTANMTAAEADLFKRAVDHAQKALPSSLASLVMCELIREDPSRWVVANWMTKLAGDVLSIEGGAASSDHWCTPDCVDPDTWDAACPLNAGVERSGPAGGASA